MIKYKKYEKLIFILILLIDMGNLFYFKYFNFFVENIQMIGFVKKSNLLENVKFVALPIGISFYTFQIISYVADVYMGKVTVQKKLSNLILYVIMFPQLIAGPIVRYKDINCEIENRTITVNDIEEGIQRFIIGFFKKVFVANLMGGMADPIFEISGNMNTLYAWFGAICYALQIYYDFSAYSDMAIGIGRMFGFHFNENFNLPYKAQSIQEFWRRWHISLSSWFRDYVYIPLGGNRKGTGRTYLNLGIVFLLTGIWHGAAWQYVVWGIYHGIFSVAERLGLGKIIQRLPKIIRHLYTLFVVIIGWVFFRSDNLGHALNYIKTMFSMNFTGFDNYEIMIRINSIFCIAFIIGITFSVTKFEKVKKFPLWNNDTFVRVRYVFLWLISILYLVGLTYNPFIYFKF